MPRLETTASSSSAGRSGRRGRGPRVSTALAEINVVPLVDVMLVLLVIFMVAAPMMQQGFDVKLPQTRRAAAIKSEPIYVTVPVAYRKDQKVQLGNDKALVGLSVLPERVRQLLTNTATKSVIVRGDADLSYQEVMDVLNALVSGGVTQVSLAMQPVGTDK